MFKNPLVGAVLRSSGAVGVERGAGSGSELSANSNSNSEPRSSVRGGSEEGTKPNEDATTTTTKLKAVSPTRTRLDLFSHTLHALSKPLRSKGCSRPTTIGVFPEGTSYTEPGIVQVMSGAGWVGVGYLKYVRKLDHVSDPNRGRSRDLGRTSGCKDEYDNGQTPSATVHVKTNLKIVPVAIVYTDKKRYLSRVCVRCILLSIFFSEVVSQVHFEPLFKFPLTFDFSIDTDNQSKWTSMLRSSLVQMPLLGVRRMAGTRKRRS